MSIFSKTYETIVIGAGVAGVHAVKEASKYGQVLLLTSSWDTAAWLNWGPIMSKASLKILDNRQAAFSRSAIKANVLTEVRTREDRFYCIDSFGYQETWKSALEKAKKVTVYQDAAENIAPGADGWVVETVWGGSFSARGVIVTVGTSLDRLVRIGRRSAETERPIETGAPGLAGALTELGVDFVTASKQSPPTVRARSVDRDKLEGFASPDGTETSYMTRLSDGRPVVLVPTDHARQQLYVSGLAFELGAIAEDALREAIGFRDVEIITPGFQADFRCLAPHQLDDVGQHPGTPGLFFAGKVAGSKTYGESITQGMTAARR